MVLKEQVSLIKGMAARGDRQMDIAVALGINQGRVNEVLVRDCRKWQDTAPAPISELPPAGPYVVVPLAALASMTAMIAHLEQMSVLKQLGAARAKCH